MDDGFQQKKNRLDSVLSSRLARGSTARAATRDEPKKCQSCSAELSPGATGDRCTSCITPASSSQTAKRCCPMCGLGVITVSSFLTCGVCRKWIHAECDRSIEADPDDYTCAKCRQSPIVGTDAMLGVPADSPLADPEASNQESSLLGGASSLMGDSMRSSPVAGSVGGESGRYSQRERRMSGSSESSSYSARNSPSFDPNACSEDDDEFRPGGFSRGGGSSRGGRGGKKKPGGRGGTLMKTRSGGKPPSGVFLDRLGKTERGKRGKGRGAGKAAGAASGKGGGAGPGRGRRMSSYTGARGGGSMAGLGNSNLITGANVNLLLQAAAAKPGLVAVLQQQMAAKVAAHQAAVAKANDDAPCTSSSSAVCNKTESGRGEKDEYTRTIVIVPENDLFIASSPLCLVCGSVGKGTESSMVACSGCAHSFHTYCVGLHDKMSATVRDRGWRCLDCCMCETCGMNNDDSKLIMCEECDVAYHMYCLSPPLERAPTGPWRCQWCAKCKRCQMRVSSSGELTKEGLCYPCLSLRKCPKCSKLYQIGDNIIRCSQCSKWYHGTCEDLHTEEMLESAALNKMRCSSCRPNAHRSFSSTNDGNITICDNVALNKCADEVLKSKMMPQLFRANSFTDSAGGSSALAGLLGEFRSGGSIDSYHGGGSMDDDNGPDEDSPGSALSSMISFGTGRGRGGGRGGGAGRGRMLKLGVGGFFVKLPKHKMLAAKEDEGGAMDPNDPTKKAKQFRKPRRSQLEDFYPSQIQEGFFGTRPVDGKTLSDIEVPEPTLEEEWKIPKTIKDPFAMGNTLSQVATDTLRTHIDESNMLENMNLNEMMNFDDTLDFDDLFNDEDDLLTDALDFMQNDTESSQPKPEPGEEGGAAGGQQQPQPSSSQHPMPHQQQQQQHPMGGMQPGMGPGGMMIKQEPGLMHPHPMMHHHPHAGMMGPGGMMIKQEPGLMRPESSMSGGSLMAAAAVGSHASERISASQAATERWEEDEPLGEKATKAAVLYVNCMYPDLRHRMPEWSERAKYIHKTWRSLSSDERQVYVQKARHNRAQREKVPRPRGPRNPALGALTSAPGPSGLTTGQVAMRMAAGAGAVPPSAFGMQGGMGGVRGPMPGMPQQPPSIDHLPPELQQQYAKLKRDAAESTQKQEVCEKELAAIRTTKKKLGAKLRQIQKVETAKALAAAQAHAAAAGLPPVTEMPTVGDLNPIDRENYETAQAQSEPATKAVENAKRDAKAQTQALHSFEMQHRIQTPYVVAHQQTNGGGGPGGPTVGGMLSATMGGRGGMGMGMGGPHGNYQHMVAPPQMQYSQMLGQERTFQLGGIGNGGGGMMGSRMGPMGRWPPALMRSPSLGAIRYDQIASPDDRDVYECLDEMIGKISYDLDGPPPMMQQQQPPQQQMGGFPGGGPSLKRMLEPMTNAPAMIGMQSMMQGDDGAPKQKKKRQIVKKATNLPTGQDYEACVDRMRASLSACPMITRKSIEPVARNENCPFHWAGMSELERFPDAKCTMGNLTLSFATDAYKDVKRVPAPAEVSMARLMPNARISMLMQMCQPASSCPSPSTPSMIRDDGDSLAPSTSQGPANAHGAAADVIRNLVNGVEKRRGVLRCLTKANDSVFPPADPHRIAFKECKKEEDEEVEIAIEIEERIAPGPSGGGEMSSSNSTSSQAGRDEITKALLQKLQQMLETKKPIEDYQMDTPPQSPTMGGVEPQMDMKPMPLGLPHAFRCRMCDRDIVGGATATGVRQSMSLLGLTPSDDGKDDSVTFCALKCYYMFVAAAKVALSPEQLARAEQYVGEPTLSRLRQISADSFARSINQSSMARVKPELTVGAAIAAGLGTHSLMGGGGGQGGGASAVGPPPPTPIGAERLGDVTSPREMRFSSLLDDPPPRKENVHVIRCIELAQLADSGRKERSRAAGEDWKKYDQATLETFLRIHRQMKELAASPKMGIEFVNPMMDQRVCVLCFQRGDGEPNVCGRLLNYDSNAWVHANCVLWSSEVYEGPNGLLENVEKTIIRGTISYCVLCGGVGATIQCYKVDCLKKFHFSCANKCFGRFLKDKTFICPNHSDVHVDVLATLEPTRKLYIPRDENKLLAKLFEHSDGGPRLILRLGAFTFQRLGQLLPEQLKTCHSSRFIFPLGYSAQRMYWSPMDARRRVKYTLSIEEHEGKPLFRVTMPPLRDDIGAVMQGQPGAGQPTVFSKPSAGEAWKDILDGVRTIRARTGAFLRSPLVPMEAENLFGLGEGVITKMTESLPGVDTLYSYSFRHGGAPILELPLAENPSGCARCEPRLRTLIKSHRRPTPSSGSKASTSGGGKRTQSLYEELQMCMKASGYKDFAGMGMNGKWDQYGSTEQSYSAYQKMRKEWRNTVYLSRSKIAGLGLYAKRDIDMGAMIIEYKGEVIRKEVCEMREARYRAQNRGIYFFAASEEVIVDATMKGGPARYINHSCDPNCSTQIMGVGPNGEDKKIIITANRPIKANEELTYDYQFELDVDDSDKVPCNCGAPNCNKWMS